MKSNIMKKAYILLIGILAAICACDPTEIKEPDGPSIVNPDDIIIDGKETLEADEQKKKLEQVATKMIDLFPVDEYEDLMEIGAKAVGYGSYIFDEYYDWSELEEAWEDIGESFFTQEEISDTETRYFLYLFLSNCTGIVEFGEYKVSYQESSQTKVIFHEDDGTKWEAEITPKKLKEVYLGEWMSSYYAGFDYDTYEDVWYTEYYDVTVEVPESLTASVTKDGKKLAEVSFSIEHNIGKDGLDIERDHVSFNCEVQLDDIKLNVAKALYDAKKGDIELAFALYKGDIFVLSTTLSGNARYTLDEDGYIDDWTGSSFNIRSNFLGEIQIEGEFDNVKEMGELLDSYIETERDLERISDKMNSLFDVTVYYDGTSSKQAAIEFEPMVYHDSYWGDEYWIEPVLVFNDGSRYLFYDYFTEEDFKSLIRKFERMVDNYESMFEDLGEDIF